MAMHTATLALATCLIIACKSTPATGMYCNVEAPGACWYLDFDAMTASPSIGGETKGKPQPLRFNDGSKDYSVGFIVFAPRSDGEFVVINIEGRGKPGWQPDEPKHFALKK